MALAWLIALRRCSGPARDKQAALPLLNTGVSSASDATVCHYIYRQLAALAPSLTVVFFHTSLKRKL